MLAQPLIEAALRLIFVKMRTIYNIAVAKRQRDFLAELFGVLFAHQGRANFTNLARYCALHEQTFRRHFKRAFDWLVFNLVLLRLRAHWNSLPLLRLFCLQILGLFETKIE